MEKITREELIKEIQKLGKELGRTPKKREYKYYNKATKMFGTWNNFIKKAGFKPLRETGITKKECENYIHNFVKEHNRIPTQKNFDNDLYLPDSKTIMRIFQATWLEVLEELGYVPDKYFHLTDDDIYKILKSEIERIGSTKKEDYNKYKLSTSPSYTYIQKRLNKKWNEIIITLGCKINQDIRTKDEWLEALRELSIKLGRTPSMADLNNNGIDSSVFYYNFGTYNNALKLLGLIPNLEQAIVTHTNEELINMYKELSEKLGKPATLKDINNYLPYSCDVFTIRFGGINELRELAGYNSVDSYKKYTKKGIERILVNAYKKYGRRLTNSELQDLSKNNNNFPSISTICRYFASTKMTTVWKEIEKYLKEDQ